MIKTVFIFLLFAGLVAAQDFSGIKIYVNPGHGGHDPANDRYIPETGYWESEGNLTKGLYLMELLQEHNATVFISRTQNRDQDDLPLSQIDADANANNVDYFHSIHSNASDATANYPLILFRGYDDSPVYPDAKRMGRYMWKQLQKLNRQWTYWPYSSENVRGDWSFYNWGTSGLGVLRYLNMPGTLSEGSFHDYLPNSFRLMNLDYRKHESIVLLRSFIDYYGLDPLPDGVVAGIVRSKTENVDYNYNYNSGLPNDKKKALNNARVILLPEHRVYMTDFHKNGFFMFQNVEPGTYQVVMEAGNYAPDTVQVVVNANATSFANGFLNKTANAAPRVFATFPQNGDTTVVTHSDLSVHFSQAMDHQAVEHAFATDPPTRGSFSWDEHSVALTYSLHDTLARSTVYHVRIDTTARSTSGQKMEQPLDFAFTTLDHHIAPQIIDYYPSEDSVRIGSEIAIVFDVPMRKAPTEAAFRIIPELSGHFEWADDSTSFSFVPDSLMQRKTIYTVRLTTQAENRYGAPLDSAFEFSFLTRYYNEIVLLKSFPANRGNGVSTQLQIFAVFNSLPNKNKVRGNFQLVDSLGNYLPIRGLKVYATEGQGIIRFEPREPLQPNAPYILRFLPQLEDVDHLPLRDTVSIAFRTWPRDYGVGPILDDFETLSDWVAPKDDALTKGIDPDYTIFSLYSLRKITGSYSGKLDYRFTSDSNGVCRLRNEERIKLPVTSGTKFGIWVYGDFSHNILELWFDRSDTVNVAAYADTINWSGWKMITIPLDSMAGNGDIYFQSIVLRQQPNGFHDGALYLDAAQYDVRFTEIEDRARLHAPGKFTLDQNYPNPFNPTTTIRYFLPKAQKVELIIYNILGQKVLQKVNEVQQAGVHEVHIDASRLASGVYLYRIKAGTHLAVRKMVVLK